MLVTFTCKGHENITFFGEVALQLLHLMGHSGTIPSAIMADDVSASLTHLQQALDAAVSAPPSDDDNESTISLANRAIPLIALLKSAIKNQSNVMWDVS